MKFQNAVAKIDIAKSNLTVHRMSQKPAAAPETKKMLHIFVFLEDNCHGWDIFEKSKISVGNSTDADITLNDHNISGLQAYFQIKGNSVVLLNKSDNNQVLVNLKPVSHCILKPLDFIQIGKYTLKIKVKEIAAQSEPESAPGPKPEPAPEPKKYHVAFYGLIFAGADKNSVKQKLSQALNLTSKKLDYLFSGQRVVLKKNVTFETGKKLQQVFQRAGAKCRLESVTEPKKIATLPIQKVQNPVKETPVPVTQTKEPRVQLLEPELKEKNVHHNTVNTFPKTFFQVIEDEEDMEEEADDVPANFSLIEMLSKAEEPHTTLKEPVLEIVKFNQDRIVDIKFLKANQKHKIIDEDDHVLFAVNKGEGSCHFEFDAALKGDLKIFRQEWINLEAHKAFINIFNRKKMYRCQIPTASDVLITYGSFNYFFRQSLQTPSPTIPEPPKQKNPFYKNLLHSAGAHIMLLIVLGIVSLLNQEPDLDETKIHFVTIDTTQIQKPVKPAPKPPKPVKKAPVPAKVKKTRPVKPSKTVVKSKKSHQKTLRRSKKKIKVAQAGKAGSNKAGGGHGGNIANRNVNQAGVLGVLGISTGSAKGVQTSDVLVAVTNLDAVASADTGGAKLKVGGIVGSLGNSKAAMLASDTLTTRGSTGALRSAGIVGNGNVAALERGTTGNKQVQGLVSAKLSKSVRVRGGGISREAVKRIIDQHLEEVTYCYETALIQDPSLMGKVIFSWKILTNGRVGEVNIKSSSIQSNEIHACIKSAIKTWQFPKPQGAEVIVSYPFVFDIVGF